MLLILVLALMLMCGCSLFGRQPGSTSPSNVWTPSNTPTQAFSTVSPGKTASQDTAGAMTKLPEAATAAGNTAAP